MYNQNVSWYVSLDERESSGFFKWGLDLVTGSAVGVGVV
jgi:hypothetical protein